MSYRRSTSFVTVDLHDLVDELLGKLRRTESRFVVAEALGETTPESFYVWDRKDLEVQKHGAADHEIEPAEGRRMVE